MRLDRCFSIGDDGVKEISFAHSGYFNGHVVDIITPDEAEEKNRLDTVCGNETFRPLLPQVIAEGMVMYVGIATLPKYNVARVVCTYNPSDKFPDVKLGDKVSGMEILNEKGQMVIVSVNLG